MFGVWSVGFDVKKELYGKAAVPAVMLGAEVRSITMGKRHRLIVMKI